MITTNLNLPPQGVIVIWEWDWFEDDVTHISETTFSHHHSGDELSEGDAESVADSDSTHCTTPEKLYTVTFKCIGCQHDFHAQETLQAVSRYNKWFLLI